MRNHFRYGAKPLAAGLCLLVAVPFEVFAQQDASIPTQLNILVVEGEGAISNTHQRVNPAPLVRVEDEHQKPLAGATVVFTLPTEGATGEFSHGAKTFIVATDDSGQAAAKGLRVNQFPGRIAIHVSVSFKGLSAQTIITMESVLPPGSKAPSPKAGSGKLIAILVIVGAAAAGGAVFALEHKGSGSSGSSPIGITPGAGTITGGH
jgi:hypothetical protein